MNSRFTFPVTIFASMALLALLLLVVFPGLSVDVGAGLLFLPILLLASYPLLARVVRREPSDFLGRLIVFGFFAKLLATSVRYTVIFDVYESGDAYRYHSAGRLIARHFRAFDFNPGLDSLTGTDFIRLFTGIVYTVVGSNVFIGFLVFSWIGFWGLYLWFKAFQTAFPDGDMRFFGVAIFLLPSMIFWPSSIGKEAWMSLAIGLTAFGVAHITSTERPGRGSFIYILGISMAAVVRPHIALMLTIPAAAILLLRRGSPGAGWLVPVTKIAGVAALLLFTIFIAGRVETRFELDDFGAESLSEELAQTTEQTTRGGSAKSVTTGNYVTSVPSSIATVLFRPFLFEAHNTQARIAALETTLLLLLVIFRLRRVVAAMRQALRRPFIVYSSLYLLLFCATFGVIGNMGIIARQRVQALPALLVLLAIPKLAQGESLDEPGALVRSVGSR